MEPDDGLNVMVRREQSHDTDKHGNDAIRGDCRGN